MGLEAETSQRGRQGRRACTLATMDAFVLTGERCGRRPDLADAAHAPASTVWSQPVLGVEQVPEPQLASPHDVIVRVAWCGICGSDLHCSEAGPDGCVRFGGPARLPVVLGHEFTGTVTMVGDAVSNIAVGDLVTAESIRACWECDECRAGHLNECRAVELLGLTVHGAFAPVVRVDARHCYRLDPLVWRFGRARALELGALLEPLGNAYRGLKRAGLHAADRVVVVGVGPIGLGAVMLARAAGVRDIVAFDQIQDRIDVARECGASAHLVAPGEIATAARGSDASLVVEAAGTVEGFELAFASLANRGRLLVLGRLPTRPALDTNAMVSKSLSLIGSRGHAGGGIFPTLVERIAAGSFDPSPMITARFPMSRVHEAFAHARAGSGVKTLVRVGP